MAENNAVYPGEYVPYPSQEHGLSEVSPSNPNDNSRIRLIIKQPDNDMESIINKLIAHLKEK